LGNLLSAWFCSTSNIIGFSLITAGVGVMIKLRETNDSLLAEINELKEELAQKDRAFNGLLNEHNKTLRNAANLQHELDTALKKLEQIGEVLA
jgi:ABC-type transporter Mla subunit MlaD